jgi:hypothetical protein
MLEPTGSTGEEVERRSAPRWTVMLAARLDRAEAGVAVRLISLSATGFSIIGELPPRHSLVTLRRGDLALRARVAWQTGGRGGARFEQPVDPARLLRPIAQSVRRETGRCVRAPLRARPLRAPEREKLIRCADLLGICLPGQLS